MKRHLPSLAFLSVAVLSILLSLNQNQAPPALGPAADSTVFSAGRVMHYLRSIARVPHLVGSAANDDVRDYLVGELRALGLDPRIQRTTASLTVDPIRSADVQNIYATRKGTASTKAILLVAHYDSAPNAPGAGDDGYAVGAILEVLRTLQYHPPLKNDLVILFTDGEEMGLLGAKVFVDELPLINDVGFVINLEGRGASGPSIMFETGEQNGWVIRQLAAMGSTPVASSLTYDLYKLLPNNTDFTVFKRKGLNGLNFAHIGGVEYYHSSLDDVQHISQATIQDHGEHLLAATLHFGNIDLTSISSPDVVYFNFLWPPLVAYSRFGAAVFAVIASALVTAVVLVGLRKGKLRIGKCAIGFGIVLLRVLLAGGVAFGVWQLVRGFQPDVGFFYLDTNYNGQYYFIAILLLASSVSIGFQRRLISSVGLENLAAGALLLWLLLTWLSTHFFTGGSYLFVWPTIAGSLGVLTIILTEAHASMKPASYILASLLAFPVLFLHAQLVVLLRDAMTLAVAPAFGVLVALVHGNLQIFGSFVKVGRPWVVPTALVFIAAAFIGLALTQRQFTEARPKPNSLVYAADVDVSKAWWISWERSPDLWTGQVIPHNADTLWLQKLFPFQRRPLLAAAGTFHQTLPAPALGVLLDQRQDSVRVLRLRPRSERGARVLSLHIPQGVIHAKVNGKIIGESMLHSLEDRKHGFLLYHFGDAPEVEVTVSAGDSLDVRVTDMTYGFPGWLGLKPRPATMIPRPYVTTDAVVVGTSFRL